MKNHSDLRIIAIPYDSGHRGFRMGTGPEHLLDNGLAEALRSRQRGLDFTIVRPDSDPPVEVAAAFELDVLVAREVHRSVSRGEIALVLSGNCNTAVGTIAGAGPEGLGIVWFDGHADFQTPETTTTGFSDDQGLSIAIGHCWKAMSAGVPGFVPVAEEHVVLVGSSEIEPAEKARLDASKVNLVDSDVLREDGLDALAVTLEELRVEVGRVYVHLDLDVLDPAKVGWANEFAPEGGLSAEELSAALSMVRERFVTTAAGIASYDAAFDAGGQILSVAIPCIEEITSS